MARSEIETILPLDHWAEIMGFDHFQFNQIGEGGGLTFGVDYQCRSVLYQYSWQKKWISRAEIANAIASAEAAMIPLLSFYPAPVYTVAEEHPYPHDARLNMPDWLTPQGRWKSIGLKRKYFCEIGIIERTLIEANKAYVESDADGDGVNDTFTISIATTETNSDYIALYFNAGDRDRLDETWRIRPINVSIASGTATITGKLSLLVDPALQLNPDPEPLSVANAIYVSSVDVYQVKPDTDTMGTAYWNRRINTAATSSDITGYDIANATNGYIRPVIGGCYGLGSAPDRITINYLSGQPLKNGRMQSNYARMIAYLSCAYLPEQSCGCERVDQILAFYRSSPTDGEQGTFPITLEQVNELGLPPVRGGFYAYQQIERIQQTLGLSI